MDRRMAAAVAAVRVQAHRQQGVGQAAPAEPDRDHQGRILARPDAEGVDAAFEQRRARVARRRARCVRRSGRRRGSAPGRRDRRPPWPRSSRCSSGAGRAPPASSRRNSTLSPPANPRSAGAPWRSSQSKARRSLVGGKFQAAVRPSAPDRGRHRAPSAASALAKSALAKRVAQQLRAGVRTDFASGEALGDAGRQGVVRIEHRDLRPAPVFDRDIDRRAGPRSSALVPDPRPARSVGATVPARRRRGRRASARCAAARRSRATSGLAAARRCTTAVWPWLRRFEQRREAVGVLRVAVGAGVEQHADDVDVAGRAGLHQRRALVRRRAHPRAPCAAAGVARRPDRRRRTPRRAAPAGRRPVPAARRARSGSAPGASCRRRRRSPAGCSLRR